MCTTVWMRRSGRVIELNNVRDFARAVGALVEIHHEESPRSTHPIGRFETHCLCPIDIEASAKAGGWELEPTDGRPDYMLRRPKVRKPLKGKRKAKEAQSHDAKVRKAARLGKLK